MPSTDASPEGIYDPLITVSGPARTLAEQDNELTLVACLLYHEKCSAGKVKLLPLEADAVSLSVHGKLSKHASSLGISNERNLSGMLGNMHATGVPSLSSMRHGSL